MQEKYPPNQTPTNISDANKVWGSCHCFSRHLALLLD